MTILLRRIERLERQMQVHQGGRGTGRPPLAEYRGPGEQRTVTALIDLCQRLSPPYARLYEQEMQRARAAREQGIHHVPSSFALAVYVYAVNHATQGRPLELPDV